MKRFLALFALAAGCAFAQDLQRVFTATLTAAGTTNSQAVNANYHTVQVIVSGSPSACTVRLEGSLDNTNWFDISGTQTCTSNLIFHVGGPRSVTYARVNLLTWTGGTNAVINYRGSN
jgi:hypothetical protein